MAIGTRFCGTMLCPPGDAWPMVQWPRYGKRGCPPPSDTYQCMPRVWYGVVYACVHIWMSVVVLRLKSSPLSAQHLVTRDVQGNHGKSVWCSNERVVTSNNGNFCCETQLGQRKPGFSLRPGIIGMQGQWSTAMAWFTMITPPPPCFANVGSLSQSCHAAIYRARGWYRCLLSEFGDRGRRAKALPNQTTGRRIQFGCLLIRWSWNALEQSPS